MIREIWLVDFNNLGKWQNNRAGRERELLRALRTVFSVLSAFQVISDTSSPSTRTGQVFDRDVELMYYGARFYDPVLGRFVQADTIVPEPGNPQDLNRYAYARNNPLRYVDPSGYWAFEEDPDTPGRFYPPGPYGPAHRKAGYDYYSDRQPSAAEVVIVATSPLWAAVGGVVAEAAIFDLAVPALTTGVEAGWSWLLRTLGLACAAGDCSLQGVIDRGFGGNRALFEQFMQKLHSALPSGTRVAIRGSSLTGYSWQGRPFDALGPGTSDLDIVLIGRQVMSQWSPKAFYIPYVNTVPLSDKTPTVAPALNPVRMALQQMVSRPVNFQAMPKWFLDLRQFVLRQPYLLLPD